jgi:hypothetical protein
VGTAQQVPLALAQGPVFEVGQLKSAAGKDTTMLSTPATESGTRPMALSPVELTVCGYGRRLAPVATVLLQK